MIVKKKVNIEFFILVKEGKKNFEIRLGNLKCKEGDTLLLQEWDPDKKELTGRTISKKIKYTFRTDPKILTFWSKEDISKHGLLIIGLED